MQTPDAHGTLPADSADPFGPWPSVVRIAGAGAIVKGALTVFAIAMRVPLMVSRYRSQTPSARQPSDPLWLVPMCVNLLLGVLLVTGGIGCLRARPAARRRTIGACAASIIFSLGWTTTVIWWLFQWPQLSSTLRLSYRALTLASTIESILSCALVAVILLTRSGQRVFDAHLPRPAPPPDLGTMPLPTAPSTSAVLEYFHEAEPARLSVLRNTAWVCIAAGAMCLLYLYDTLAGEYWQMGIGSFWPFEIGWHVAVVYAAWISSAAAGVMLATAGLGCLLSKSWSRRVLIFAAVAMAAAVIFRLIYRLDFQQSLHMWAALGPIAVINVITTDLLTPLIFPTMLLAILTRPAARACFRQAPRPIANSAP